MSFFTKKEARDAARNNRGSRSSVDVLTASMESYKDQEKFDIFLSHSINDSEIVHGVMTLLKKQGFTVYVDWIVDRQLNRELVNKETAAMLRNRMINSSSMIYIATDNSSGSKWMPWELGFFDGCKPSSVAVLPLLDNEDDSFQGQEYLGLYPVVTKHKKINSVEHYVEDSGVKFTSLNDFAKGGKLWKRY